MNAAVLGLNEFSMLLNDRLYFDKQVELRTPLGEHSIKLIKQGIIRRPAVFGKLCLRPRPCVKRGADREAFELLLEQGRDKGDLRPELCERRIFEQGAVILGQAAEEILRIAPVGRARVGDAPARLAAMHPAAAVLHRGAAAGFARLLGVRAAERAACDAVVRFGCVGHGFLGLACLSVGKGVGKHLLGGCGCLK